MGYGATLMHERTGAIAHFETDQDAEDAGYTLISKLQPDGTNRLIQELMGRNRKERRAWMAQRRRANKNVRP